MSSWKYSDPLKSKLEVCDECHGNLVFSDDDPAEVTIYTREGTKFCQHFTRVCPNRWCRKRFNFGYSIKNNEKTYEKLTASSTYLVSSNETAFAVDYLYECTLHFLHSNATMQGMADVYNQFHNFEGEDICRKNLNSKRLASGFFIYGFLEMTSRCGIFPKFPTEKSWLDDSILENYTALKTVFSNVWCAPHQCKVDNCEGMMITDGGMKINRYLIFVKYLKLSNCTIFFYLIHVYFTLSTVK